MVGRKNSDEVRREVDRSGEERLRRGAPEAGGGSCGRNAEEARELEAAGWERREDGPKAIWRVPLWTGAKSNLSGRTDNLGRARPETAIVFRIC